jgi:hypothetical protein
MYPRRPAVPTAEALLLGMERIREQRVRLQDAIGRCRALRDRSSVRILDARRRLSAFVPKRRIH